MLAHRSNAQWHRSPIPSQSPSKSVFPVSSSGPLKGRLPRPPRVPLGSPSSSHSEQPWFPGQTKPSFDHKPGSNISNQHNRVLLPSKPPNSAQAQSTTTCASSAGEEEMSEMALNYIRRWVLRWRYDDGLILGSR